MFKNFESKCTYITPTRRRVRVSKYITLVNTVGAVVGAELLYLYFIYKKQSLSTVMWRTDRDSNPGDGHPPTHFPGVRLRPLGHLSVTGVYTAQLC